MRFKVGDKVVCYQYGVRYLGEIVSVGNWGGYLVHCEDLEYGHNGIHEQHLQDNIDNYWFLTEELELVDDQLGKIDGEMQDLHMKLHYILKEWCRDKSDEYRKSSEKVKELLTKTIDELQVLLAYEDSHKEDN